MREFTLSTTIDASPAEAWDVLADFERYPQWHPLVERLTAETQWSTRLKAVLQITRRVTLNGSLLEFDPPRRMHWDGTHPFWGLLRPKYTLELTSDRGETVLKQTLKAGGLLPRIAPGVLTSIPDALAESAHAIKQQIERQPQPQAA